MCMPTLLRDLDACMASPREEAIVVLNGCFCPVHAGHVHTLETAKRMLESRGLRVAAGYFAVAPDRAVRKKVGKLEGWQRLEARLDMCSAAALDSTEPGWSISAAAFGGWKECGTEMVRQHHAQATQVFSVPNEAKNLHPTTSTCIRAELARSGACGETVDDLVRRRLLGAAAGERLKRWLAKSNKNGHRG